MIAFVYLLVCVKEAKKGNPPCCLWTPGIGLHNILPKLVTSFPGPLARGSPILLIWGMLIQCMFKKPEILFTLDDILGAIPKYFGCWVELVLLVVGF